MGAAQRADYSLLRGQWQTDHRERQSAVHSAPTTGGNYFQGGGEDPVRRSVLPLLSLCPGVPLVEGGETQELRRGTCLWCWCRPLMSLQCFHLEAALRGVASPHHLAHLLGFTG